MNERTASYTGPCGVCRMPIYAGDKLVFLTRGRARIAAHPCHQGEPTRGPAASEDWRDDYERRVYGRRQARYLPELPPERPELGDFTDATGLDPHAGERGL